MFESLTEELIQGSLQIQTIDTSNGFLSWEEKRFSLNVINSELRILNLHNEIIDKRSLRDVSHVQICSMDENETSFDINWNSNEVWSLLADDPETCRTWVQYLNIAVKLANTTSKTNTHTNTKSNGDVDVDVSVDQTYTTVEDASSSINNNNSNNKNNNNNNINDNHRSSGNNINYLEQQFSILQEQTRKEREEALAAQHYAVELEKQEIERQKQISTSQSVVDGGNSPIRSRSQSRSPTRNSRVTDTRSSMSIDAETLVLRQKELERKHLQELAAVSDQHSFDMERLRGELSDERRRYATLWQKERQAVDVAEDNEAHLRFELSTARESCARAEAESARLREQMRRESSLKSKEFDQEKALWEDRLKTAVAEHNAANLQIRQETEAKITAMQQQFDATLREMEATVKSTARKEAEAERIRIFASSQKKFEKDLQSIKSEEIKKAQLEISRMKKTSQSKESAVVADVRRLQELHEQRTDRYEQQLKELRDRCRIAESAAEQNALARAQTLEKMRKLQDTHARQLGDLGQHGKALETKLASVLQELQESRSREAGYREHLERSLEEGRMQRAEILEVRRRAGAQEMEAHQWAAVAKEAGGAHAAITHSEQIARDEIALLEHEIDRLRDENRKMKQSHRRYESQLAATTTVINDSPSNFVKDYSSGRSHSLVGMRMSHDDHNYGSPTRGKRGSDGTAMTAGSRRRNPRMAYSHHSNTTRR